MDVDTVPMTIEIEKAVEISVTDPGDESTLDVAKDDVESSALQTAQAASEEIEEVLGSIAEQNPMTSWVKSIVPFLKPGGKPVAVILALGLISIPLMVSGSVWVPPILAIGASIVAVLALL